MQAPGQDSGRTSELNGGAVQALHFPEVLYLREEAGEAGEKTLERAGEQPLREPGGGTGGRRGGTRWTDGLETWGVGIQHSDPVRGAAGTRGVSGQAGLHLHTPKSPLSLWF